MKTLKANVRIKAKTTAQPMVTRRHEGCRTSSSLRHYEYQSLQLAIDLRGNHKHESRGLERLLSVHAFAEVLS